MRERWIKAGLICTLLLLGACSSTSFVYNRLDFIVPWYADDYVDLGDTISFDGVTARVERRW